MKVVAIVSGGMDSVVMAHNLAAQHHDLTLLSFDYGQRHHKEVNYARQCAQDVGAQWHMVDLVTVSSLLTGSALTDPKIDVPDGHYAAESMRLTVVPNRNAMMLEIAIAVAVAQYAPIVATAVHAGDHAIYPDCRPEFIKALTYTALVANEGFIHPDFQIHAPFIEVGKHDIAKLGSDLGVDFGRTWSCYKGGHIHCGVCGTCTERKEAFELADIHDPTDYEA